MACSFEVVKYNFAGISCEKTLLKQQHKMYRLNNRWLLGLLNNYSLDILKKTVKNGKIYS